MKSRLERRNSYALGRAFRGLLGVGLLQVLVLGLAATSSQAGMQAVRIATGLSFPLYVCAPPGDATRVFVPEQGGKIKIILLADNTVLPTPFLDISAIVGQGQGTGILGMTFDPNYKTNGFFYVSYTTSSGGVFNSGQSFVSRFSVTADPNVADPQSQKVVITIDQPQHDHNFDWIGFSPRAGDAGNLYICSGDGGASEDQGPGHIEPGGNAQNLGTLLGKILRIHIEADGSYTIPPNNPFVGVTGALPEIFCYGLRNPFRASFDPANGNFFIGDVGEHAREEIDVNPANNPTGGENFGWRVREGLIQNSFYPNDPPPPNAIDPVIDYTHETTGVCAIGGYIYHGRIPDLKNLYVFGDFSGPGGQFAGKIMTMIYKNGVASNLTDITSLLFPTKIGGYTLGPLTSLGLDARGELYITDYNGNVFKIAKSR